ncbi:hypothetical protein PM082_014578 [Marasmius tenuissimus]|nr:hypothetical protein PM082_014578 [Marasmius tenuissimus]
MVKNESAEVVQYVVVLLKVKEESRSLVGNVEDLGKEVKGRRTRAYQVVSDGMKGEKGAPATDITNEMPELVRTAYHHRHPRQR